MNLRPALFWALLATWAVAGEYHYYNGGQRMELTPVVSDSPARRGVSQTMRFLDEKGRKITIGRRLIVRFEKEAEAEALLKRYGLKVVKRYSVEGMYLLEAASWQAAIEAANALATSPEVRFAQPDVQRRRRLR